MGIIRDLYVAKKMASAGLTLPAPSVAALIKRLYLARMVNTGDETTVSGTAPLTLANAIAKAMLGLTQYGKVEQRNIPAPYTELEYVTMPASSCISNTSITILPTYKVELEFETGTLGSSLGNIFGGRRSGSTAGNGIRLSKLSNKGVAMYGFDSTKAYESSSGVLSDNTRYTFTYEDGVITLTDGNGTTVATQTYTPDDTEGTTHWAINGYYAASLSSNSDETKWISLRIWDNNGSLIVDYVSARNSDSVGMYDSVSDTLVTATAGTFTAGPVATPTPKRPQDIWCNNGKLCVRQNLFDRNDSSMVLNAYVGSSNVGGKAPITGSSSDRSFIIPVLPNTQYTVRKLGGSSPFNRFRISETSVFPATGNTSTKLYENTEAKEGLCTTTVTTSATANYLIVYGLNGSPTDNMETFLANFVVCEGNEINGIYYDGTPETLTVSGKNMVSPSDIVESTYIRAGNATEASPVGSEVSGSSLSCTTYIKVQPNTKYTTTVPRISVSTSAGLCFYESESVASCISSVPISTQGDTVYTFTTPNNCNYIRFSWFNADGNAVQLEKGEGTPYEPYVTPQTITGIPDLLAYDSIFDEVDLVPGTTKRRIAACLYDGTQTIGDRYMSTTGGKDVGAIIVYPRETEYNGEVATFTTEDAVPLNGLEVEIEPVQDLHGYSKPWAAGAGKNLAHLAFLTNNSTGADYRDMTDNAVTIYSNSAGAGYRSCVFSLFAAHGHEGQTITVSMTANQISGGSPNGALALGILTTATGSQVGSQLWQQRGPNISRTFTLPETIDDGVFCSVFLYCDTDNSSPSEARFTNVQAEFGSSATSFEPYENECPITGVTGLTAYIGPTEDPDDATAYTADWSDDAGTVYAGTYDFVTGNLGARPNCDSYNGETLVGPWLSSLDEYTENGTPTTGAQVVDLGGAKTAYQLTAQDPESIPGTNNVWSDSGDVTVYVPDTVYEQTTPQEITLHRGTNTVSVSANVDDVYLKARYLRDGEATPRQAMNILMAGNYRNDGGPDEASDKEALDITLGR